MSDWRTQMSTPGSNGGLTSANSNGGGERDERPAAFQWERAATPTTTSAMTTATLHASPVHRPFQSMSSPMQAAAPVAGSSFAGAGLGLMISPHNAAAAMALHNAADGVQSPSSLSLQGLINAQHYSVRGYSAAATSSALALPISSFGSHSVPLAGLHQLGLPMVQPRAQSHDHPSNPSLSLPWNPQASGAIAAHPPPLSQLQLQQLLLQHQAQQQRAMQAQAHTPVQQQQQLQQTPSRQQAYAVQLPSPSAAQVVYTHSSASTSSAFSPAEPPPPVSVSRSVESNSPPTVTNAEANRSNAATMEDVPQPTVRTALVAPISVAPPAAAASSAKPVTAASGASATAATSAVASAASAAAASAPSASSSSSLLQSPFDSELWLLMLHQLYHSPAAWARDMAQTMFLQLQHEAQKAREETQQRQLQLTAASGNSSVTRQRIVAAAASDPSALLSASDWTGAPRPLTLDELMSRQSSAAFPRDYTAQLLRELMASKARDAAASSVGNDPLLAEHSLASPFSVHASPSKRKPLLPGIGHSLLGSTAAAGSSMHIWATGSHALLPSLRRRGPDTRGTINVISHLLHRSRGSPRIRSLGPSSVPVTSSASALTNTLYCRALRKLKMVTGHTSPIYCVVLDRTGQRAFTGSDDHTVKIWEVSSGRLLVTCRGHENVITEIVVSPDNTIVASSSLDKRIRLWDINGVAIGVLVGHTADVMRVVFNPDWSCSPSSSASAASSSSSAAASASSGRRLLISASLDGTARIWDCANLGGQPVIVTSRPKPWPRDMEHNAYVPYDPELLAARGNEDESALNGPPQSANPECNCIAFHPEGREFVCGHSDLRARVYDVSRGCLFAILSGHKAEVEHVCYSADGQRILTVAADGEAIVWSRIEFSQIVDSCRMVHAELPLAPPSSNPNAWDASAAPLPGANFYRALRAPPAANYSQQASAAMVDARSIDPATATTGAHLPTHRYIITARLIVAPPSAFEPSGPLASGAAAAPPAAVAAKIQLASWSLHDDFIVGCTDKHAVLVWRIPPLLMDAEGRPKLERQDPYMAQQIQWAEQSKHATTRSATGAISTAKPAPPVPERATGRSKRLGSVNDPLGGGSAAASAAPSASLGPAPLNFLSCFRRQTLAPQFTFTVHSESIGVLHRHPVHPDLIVSAGADGRVVWYDAARGRVLRVFRETVPTNAPVPAGLSAAAARKVSRMPSAFIDGNFSPASSTGAGGGGGSMLLLTTETGQIYFMGSGVGNGSAYLLAPEQQFFVRDYLELQRDALDNVIDLDSQTLPHLAPGATTLQDAGGNVYPHQLPPVPPLVRRAIGVSHPLPIRAPARARIKLFAAGREPKYICTSVQSMRTGWSLSEPAASAQSSDEPIEVDSDCWRTSVGPTSKLSHLIPTDLTPAQFASLWRLQLTRDSEALKFLYQLRVAWQQQRGIIRVANRFHAQERARSRAADSDDDSNEPMGLVIPPTWHPSMSFPLPASTPLLDATEEAQVHDEDEMEGAEETRLYRGCEFDSRGMAKKHKQLFSERRGTSNLPAPRSPERPARNRARAAAAAAPAAAAAAAADARGSTRRRPISLDDFDDDYRDDDFDPAAGEDADDAEEPHEDDAALPAGAGRNQRRNARAQGRALRRFEEMKEEQPQARPSRSTRQTAAAAAAAEEEEEDEEEEEKAAAAEANSSRDHSEYSEAEEQQPAPRTRAGRSRDVHEDSESSASDDASDSDLLDSPPPSNSDSDASYGAHRAEGGGGSSNRNKRKRKSKGRASRRSNRQRRDDDAPHVGRSTRNSGAAAAAAASSSGHEHSTRRSSKRSRAEQDWSEGEYDEDEEQKLQHAERAARARKRRDASKHNRSYQDTQQEDDEREFADEDAAEQAEDGATQPEASRLLRQGNWLERPLSQQYNAVYTPQLGDEVVYCRVGHESALKSESNRGYPRTHLPNPALPPFVSCVVARVQYMWIEDAHQAGPRNRYERLTKATGHVNPAVLILRPPFVFARITLVPMRDAHLIRNPAHPIPSERGASPEQPAEAMHIEELNTTKEEQSIKAESTSAESNMTDDAAAAAAAAASPSAATVAATAPVPERTYDFSSLTPPTRWFECTKSTPDQLVLKRVVRPGDDWIPVSEKVARKRRLEDEQLALAAARAAAEEEERNRRKRSLRGAEPEPEHAVVPQRQSVRSVILQSKLEAAAPAASQPAAAASSSQRTRTAPRRNADYVDDYEPLPYDDDEDADPDRALAMKLQAQQPARSSARNRIPKKPDPYEAQLLSQAPQYAPTRPRSTGVSTSSSSKPEVSLRSPNADGSSMDFPASAFIVDLFEPQGADYIVLASRIRACGSMAPWVSQSSDADGSWSSSPSPAAAAASSSSAAASSVRQWERGDRFRMKFVDQSEWSEGVILSNALHEDAIAAANATAAATAARVTRNAARHGPVAPSPPPGPVVTPWECLRVAWKSEEELQQMLAEQAAARAGSLVATENLSHLSPEAAAAHRRLQLLSSLSPDEFVSPWEIDPVDRPITEIEDIDCWIASMASRADMPAPASASASSSSSFSPSRVCHPELIHLSHPNVYLDLGETIDPKLTSVLLDLIDSFLTNSWFAPFAQPVRGIKLYEHVVPYASDLATMRSRLELRYYRSVAALASDVRALFDAALLFNDPASAIVLGAQRLEERMMRALYRATRSTGDFARIIQPANLVAWEKTEEQEAEEQRQQQEAEQARLAKEEGEVPDDASSAAAAPVAAAAAAPASTTPPVPANVGRLPSTRSGATRPPRRLTTIAARLSSVAQPAAAAPSAARPQPAAASSSAAPSSSAPRSDASMEERKEPAEAEPNTANEAASVDAASAAPAAAAPTPMELDDTPAAAPAAAPAVQPSSAPVVPMPAATSVAAPSSQLSPMHAAILAAAAVAGAAVEQQAGEVKVEQQSNPLI